MTKIKSNQIQNPATEIPVPLDQCLNCGEQIYQIQDTRNGVNAPKLSTAVVAFDSFVRNSRTQVFMRDALKEIFGLLYLVQLNKDSDGCALCVDCCLVFAQLYGLFHTFESRRKSDGFLGSTLKLAFKSLAAASWVVPAQNAEEIGNDEDMGAGREAAMETDPSDVFIVIQGISAEENSSADDAEDDDDDEDVDMPQTFHPPASPHSDSDQDVEMPENIDDGRASPVDVQPASPVDSGPASPIENDPASPAQSEPDDTEELNPFESTVAPSPPASPSAPKTPKAKPVCIFKCINCAKTFQGARELGTHRVKVHKAEFPFACHLCSYKTKNSCNLTPHIVRHSAPWSLKCKVCKRLFKIKHDLRHHLRRTHKLTNFVTEEYMEGESNVPNLIRSTKTRVQAKVVGPSAGEEVTAGTSQDIKSEESSKKSGKISQNSNKKLEKSDKNNSEESDGDDVNSKSNAQSESLPDAAKDEKSYADSDSESSSSFAPSDASNASSDSENDDEESPKTSKSKPPKPTKESVQVTYKCTDCHEEFDNVSVFSQHREKIHEKSGNEIYKCHCCFKLFARPSYLALHLTRKAMSGAVDGENKDEDTSSYLLQCLDCSLKFKFPAALGRHRKDVHKSPNLFVCHVCEYIAPHSSLLKPHILRHMVPASLKCPECDKYFKLKADVACHMRKTHKIRRIVRRSIHNEPGKPTVVVPFCRKCDQEFDSEEDLIQHRKIAHGDEQTFYCDICRAIFFNKNYLNAHKLRHTRKPRFKCAHCGKTFHEAYTRKAHEETMHVVKPAAFKCSKCQMPFGSMEALEAHNDRKHKANRRVGTFTCDICGMSFTTKDKWQSHWHARHKPRKCPHCDLKVPTRELTVHIKAKHPEKYGPYSKKKAQEEQSETPPKDVQLHCCDCTAIFPTLFSFRHHRQEEHGTPEDQIMMCHLCNLVYRQEDRFILHVGAHNESSDWPCAHCQMRFTQRRHRNRHHVRDHGLEKDMDAMLPLPPAETLECLQGESSIAAAAQSSKAKLGRPRATSINDSKPFKCLECDAEFARPKQLGIHRTIAHGCKDEERYQCHICHQFYKTDVSLYTHMPRHSERDQLCESCGKGFKTMSDLVQHYQLNHTQDGSKHLREKWKRWRDKKSLGNRATSAGRRVEKNDEDSDTE